MSTPFCSDDARSQVFRVDWSFFFAELCTVLETVHVEDATYVDRSPVLFGMSRPPLVVQWYPYHFLISCCLKTFPEIRPCALAVHEKKLLGTSLEPGNHFSSSKVLYKTVAIRCASTRENRAGVFSR